MRNQRPELSNQVLDALTESIALLDGCGRIVGVNEAWRRFAANNGGDCGHYYIGESYLEACERAALGGCDDIAPALYDGLRRMLAGELEQFSLEYPCHSPQQQRWFIVNITRCATSVEPAQLVVAHLDITARKLAELALEQTEHELARINRELQEALARERRAARSDELTGIANRRHFFVTAAPLFEVARRYRQPLAAVMLDLDHFKQVNDSHGHQAGDQALRHVAAVARQHLRECDLFARYGGEEFVILLPATGGEGALCAAERIRAAIAAQPLVVDGRTIRVTVSAGIAEIVTEGDSLERMIGRADRALYAAKGGGRNRCRLISEAQAQQA